MLTPLSVFSAAIALGVLLPPYIWSYDYVLLVIPLCYICFELLRRKRGYLYALLFLFVLDGVSLWAAFLFSTNPESSALTIQRDMWSIWVAVLTLAVCWWLVFGRTREGRRPCPNGGVDRRFCLPDRTSVVPYSTLAIPYCTSVVPKRTAAIPYCTSIIP